MESTRQRLGDPPPVTRGVAGDLRRLGRDGSASAAELREFFARMRGKSPQEALGLVSQSGLFRAMVISTAAFALVIAVFTLVPYALSGGKDTKADAPATAAAKPDEEAKPQAAPAANAAAPQSVGNATDSATGSATGNAATTAGATSDANANGSTPAGVPDLDRAARLLEIDEAKGTDPSDVPDIDNILDKQFD